MAPSSSPALTRPRPRSIVPERPRCAARLQVLDADPELGAALAPAPFSLLRQHCTARRLRLAVGAVPPGSLGLDDSAGSLGMLVVRGLVLHHVTFGGRRTVDLAGPGDVIRPWPAGDDWTELMVTTGWHVIEPLELAVLDRVFLDQSRHCPEILIAILDRVARQSQSLILRLALAQLPSLSVRIWLLLWHLADRFGTVDADGVLVHLQLSHATLGELVGAQRPSVSRSLKQLAGEGSVLPVAGGWRLSANAPELLREAPNRHPADTARATA